MVFNPEFNYRGDVISYSAHLENLYIKMISDKLLVMNSWHKFYKVNNYSDFTWEELQDCMQTLSQYFGEGFWNARITKLTTAVNLTCNTEIMIDRLISFKGNPMEPMRPSNSSKVYGKRYASTHYNIKVYNKQFEVKKDARIEIVPTLRIEKEMRMPYFQKRRQNPIHIFSPMDLIKFV